MLKESTELTTCDNGITPKNTSGVAIVSNTYIHAATSDNTRKAYRSDIQHFVAWGGLLPATTETIVQYLQHYATLLNPRTLARRLISLRQWHTLQGFIDPTENSIVSKTLKGIKRIHGIQKRKATGLFFEQLSIMSNHLTQSGTLRDLRNNALLLLQFAGAFRVSEIVSIRLDCIFLPLNIGLKRQA